LLLETINSIFSQTRLPDEAIVVDCGSKDGTRDAVLRYSQKVIFLETKTPGASSQRNIGISHAKSDYIAFLDDDDIWHPEKLKIQMEFLETHPEIAMASSENVRIKHKIKIKKSDWIFGDLYMKLFMKSFIHTSTVVIKKDVFDKIDGFNENYKRAEDYDLWLRISRNFPLAHTKTPLTWVRKCATRLSSDKIDLRNTAMKVLKEQYDPDKISKRKFKQRISDIEISLGRRYVKAGNKEEGKNQFLSAIKRYPYRIRPYRYLLSTIIK